jgi:stage III sporulation protein AA
MEKERSKQASKKLEKALSYLPGELRERVLEIAESEKNLGEGINEIRIRAHGASAVFIGGRNISLGVRLGESDVKEIVTKVMGGATFAHRDDVCRGFLTLEGGVRVGVAGHAKYDGFNMVGVSDISSLVFRIPTSECSFARSLYADWLIIGGGMLICSRAGEGKTTVIRALARLIGSGERPKRVVAVDERCELDESEYRDAHVDILRGYRRALGVDIAIRTLSCEVLIVDEISSREDSSAMLAALGAGVTVIATAHAQSLGDALKRDCVRELVDGGLFSSVCIVSRKGEDYSYRIEKIDRDGNKMLYGKVDV